MQLVEKCEQEINKIFFLRSLLESGYFQDWKEDESMMLFLIMGI
jgi:hypothetical protein